MGTLDGRDLPLDSSATALQGARDHLDDHRRADPGRQGSELTPALWMDAPKSSPAEWIGWMAAAGIGAERILKMWRDWGKDRDEKAKHSDDAADNMFNRALAMIDKQSARIDKQDSQIESLTARLAEVNADNGRLRTRLDTQDAEIETLKNQLIVLRHE